MTDVVLEELSSDSDKEGARESLGGKWTSRGRRCGSERAPTPSGISSPMHEKERSSVLLDTGQAVFVGERPG